MPFTISHTIVAFPIKRIAKRLPLDALMIGATGPDLEYLYNLRVHGKYWHTLEGLLIGAVPVCLVLVFLWRKAVYQSILAMLPQLHEKGLVPSRMKASIGYTVIAVIIGGFTHIVWDAFTHFDGWGVELFPQILLRRTPIEPSYAWLQDISSAIGVIVLTVKLRKAWRLYRPSLPSLDRRRLFMGIGAVTLLSTLGGILNTLRWYDERWGIILGQFAIGAMAAGVLIIALLSAMILTVRWWTYKNQSLAKETL
jgi:hypothetical protein